MRSGAGVRVMLGLALAVAAIAALQWCVAGQGDAVGGAAPGPDDLGPLLLDVSLPAGEAASVVLVHDPAALPDDAAPVLEVGRGGAVRIVVAAPPPPGPAPTPWPIAGVVLPQPALAALDPRERVRLLQILAAWGGPRGLVPERLRWLGVEATGAEIETLLRWRR